MSNISLIDVTSENWFDVCCLHPGEEGGDYVASNAFSIAESVYSGSWTIKGITVDGRLIGFTMYGPSTDDEIDGYEICRLMIDESEQGHGYGKQAMRVIVDEMIRAFHCKEIFLSTSPQNARGKHVYESAGFRPTGEICGEGEDAEEIFRLAIS